MTLPDDVMRTKSLVLHPVTVEEAVGELELVTAISLQLPCSTTIGIYCALLIITFVSTVLPVVTGSTQPLICQVDQMWVMY